MAVAAVFAFDLVSGLTFHRDEWAFIVDRQGAGADTLLEPYNEHPILLPLLLFKGLFNTVGLESYWPYQALVIGLHLLVCGLLFEFARHRVGDALAAVPALIMLFFGPGWENIVWPTQIVFSIPLSAALGALLLLERDSPRADLAASGLLVIAFASGSLGVPVAAGAGAYLLLGDRRWRRLLRVVAVPGALYAAWLLAYSPSNTVEPADQLSALPGFLLDRIGGNLASLLSLDDSWAWALTAALAVLVVLRVARHPRSERMLLALLAMSLSYWVLLGLFRPEALASLSRYLYPGALFLLLIATELARGVRLRGPGLAAAYVVTAVVVIANVHELEDGADRLRQYSDYVGASLGALELASAQVEPDYAPEPLIAPHVVAGDYLAAVAQFGSPAATPDEIVGRSPSVRREADIVLTRALGLGLENAPIQAGGGEPAVARLTGGRLARAPAGCVRFEPEPAGSIEVRFAAPGLALRAGDGRATMRLRRFAEGYGPDDAPAEAELFPDGGGLSVFGSALPLPLVLELPPAQATALRIPADDFRRPWHARVTTDTPTVVCGLP